MGLTTTFSEPFYTGGGVSAEVPGLYSVAIDGHPYLVDLKSNDFTRRSIPLLRNQADTANLPGEQSINPEDLWRRSAETWHKGAGQDHFDRHDSDDARFRSSKGIYVWEKWELSLLNTTALKLSTTDTNLFMVVAGSRWYVGYGDTASDSLNYSTTSDDVDDFTPVTGTPNANVTGLTSDGVNVWAAYGGSGIYHTTTALSAATQRITSAVSGPLAYVKGRLMAADAESIYNITANSVATTSTTTLPAALYTHTNVNFRWVGFAEGANHIYMAGFSGDKSLIYRTQVQPDGTSLDIPVVAGELPDGEIVRSIQGYLGFILIGTDEGVRFATADGNGNLTFGSVIRTSDDMSAPVRCFEPQERFVWFGWSPYDGVSVGLGRLDLSIFTEPYVPAYASDLMVDVAVPADNPVVAVITFDNKRIFAVSGVGFYVEDGDKVSSGTLDSGLITYGLYDNKIPMYVDVRSSPLNGSYQVFLASNDGSFESLGITSMADSTQTVFLGGRDQASRFELRLKLNRDSVDASLAPIVNRLSVRAYPAIPSGEIFIVPLLLHESIQIGDIIRPLDPQAEFNFLRTIQTDHRLVLYQEGLVSHSVFLDDYEWRPHHLIEDGTFWNGTMVVKLKSLAAE